MYLKMLLYGIFDAIGSFVLLVLAALCAAGAIACFVAGLL